MLTANLSLFKWLTALYKFSILSTTCLWWCEPVINELSLSRSVTNPPLFSLLHNLGLQIIGKVVGCITMLPFISLINSGFIFKTVLPYSLYSIYNILLGNKVNMSTKNAPSLSNSIVFIYVMLTDSSVLFFFIN